MQRGALGRGPAGRGLCPRSGPGPGGGSRLSPSMVWALGGDQRVWKGHEAPRGVAGPVSLLWEVGDDLQAVRQMPAPKGLRPSGLPLGSEEWTLSRVPRRPQRPRGIRVHTTDLEMPADS